MKKTAAVEPRWSPPSLQNNLKTAEYLLHAGADIRRADHEGKTTLMAASFLQNTEMVKMLLKQANTDPVKYRNVVTTLDKEGNNALTWALANDNYPVPKTEVVRELIQYHHERPTQFASLMQLYAAGYHLATRTAPLGGPLATNSISRAELQRLFDSISGSNPAASIFSQNTVILPGRL